MPRIANTIGRDAEAQDKLCSLVTPIDGSTLDLIVRGPLGVIGLVLPWSFPLLMVSRKLRPTLATGNSVALKPSQRATLTALRLVELAVEAGVALDVFNVVTGSREIGEGLGLHHDVRIISFTGSTAVERKLLDYSRRSNLQRIEFEPGGTSIEVVLAAALDLILCLRSRNFSLLTDIRQMRLKQRLIVRKAVKEELTGKSLKNAMFRAGALLSPLTTRTEGA